MKILGIETSCDEAAAAVVEDGVHIISNVVATSVELHKKTGGIIPEQAAREQIKCMIPVLEEALREIDKDSIDAIAVTVGPGLIGSLLVGVETAKTLAYVWRKPIVPVNHLVGHIYANFVNKLQTSNSKFQTNSKFQILNEKNIFPSVVLIVSGGHTELVLMKGHSSFQFIGGTRDDAGGEAFDKAARILGLPYPGGPSIQHAAEKFQIPNSKSQINSKHQFSNYKLPRPMMDSGDFDFSFSGLKTALLRLTASHFAKASSDKSEGQVHSSHRASEWRAVLSEEKKNYLAYEIQEAITDVLVEKTIKAAEYFKVGSIMLAGGVVANTRLRKKMERAVLENGKNYILSIPPPQLCTDNAVYIASAAFFNYYPLPVKKIMAEPGLEITGDKMNLAADIERRSLRDI